jgi:hypothetical protein
MVVVIFSTATESILCLSIFSVNTWKQKEKKQVNETKNGDTK